MEKDKVRIKIEDLLRSHVQGLTISEIMKKLNLARHTVLARLHKMEGQGKVRLRKINMAKLYYWDEDEEEQPEIKSPIEVKPIKKKHVQIDVNKPKKRLESFDVAAIKEEIERELRGGRLTRDKAHLEHQRRPVKRIIEKTVLKKESKPTKYVQTDVPGFDDLFEYGIPEGSNLLIAGGAGSGKTIMGLQILHNKALEGKKCLYMSFEESEDRLKQHMRDFGWHSEELIRKGTLLIKRFNPFDITRSVDALLMEAKGELLIDIEPIIFPSDFKPDFVVVDSLTAIASAFTEKEDSYRIYIEQLFRFFEKIAATAFMITETQQIPTIFSQTGVEEFLADGVIVLYNIKRGNIRESAIEVLKLRGAKHQKKIVAMQITDEGIVVYPEQEVFGGLGDER